MVLMFASFLIVIRMQAESNRNINRNYQNGLINQTYNRATNCFTAHDPNQRTPELREWCYDIAEKATGTKIERYGRP